MSSDVFTQDDIASLQEIVRSDPYDFEAVSSLSRIFIAQENYESARSILDTYLSKDSTNAMTLYLYGRVMDLTDNILEAMAYYLLSIEKDSTLWLSYRDMALLYDVFADYENMNRFILDAFNHTPFPESLYYEVGYSYDMLEQPESAAVFYRLAVQSDSADNQALMNLGAIWGNWGNADSAKYYTKKSLEVFPDSPGACFNFAEIMAMEGDTVEAISYFCRALALEPDLFGAQKRLGELFEAQGDSAMAKIYFEEFLKAVPIVYADDINEVKEKLDHYR
jgi:tetratricopeptide (TPR) repeat protein